MLAEFEDVKGYENLYKINRNGVIQSCLYKIFLKPQLNNSGYHFVHLMKGGERKKFYIHRLVGLQYLPNLENLPQIDHIDRDKLNNSIENLRWVNNTDNCRNRANWIGNLTEEQKQERIDRVKKQKREWYYKNKEKNANTQEIVE